MKSCQSQSLALGCRQQTEAHCFVSNVYQRAWLYCCVQCNSLIEKNQIPLPMQSWRVIVSRINQVPGETSDHAAIWYHMPFVVAQKETQLWDLLFSLSSVFSIIFFFLFMAGGNKPGPFRWGRLLPLAIPLCFVSKGQGSAAGAVCPADPRRGPCCLSCFITGGRLTSPDCT